MDDTLEKRLTQDDLKSAQEYTKRVRSLLMEESAASRKVYETFHTNLALFSSGTLALSITYLGYLKSSGAHVGYIKVLVASWTCLMLTIPMSLFVSYLHSHHLSYGRIRELQFAQKSQREAEVDAILSGSVINLKQDEIATETAERKARAQQHEKEGKRVKRLEDLYYRLWRSIGFAARTLFVAGLALLYVFASWNALHP